jgi:glyoxylase-like metal-dependent hydrolase (beta-lactamase superfamily II)
MRIIPAGNASAWTGPGGNNTYLIEGRVPTLVDAGIGAPEHLDTLAGALAGAALSQVVVTHGHPDHASGIAALQERWPAVEIRALAPLRSATLVVNDGDVVAAGDASLVVVATPGHAPDHAGFFDEETRDFYCGDLVREGGSIVIGASQGGDVGQYLRSLRRVGRLQPARLLPGHGPIIDDPAAVLDRIIRHRLDREAQVLEALSHAPRTLSELVTTVYADLAPALEPAAADTLLAHLLELERTGRAVRRGSGWSRA